LKTTNQPKKFWRMQLDYDLPSREEVEADAEKLVETFPQLGGVYRIEQGKQFYHVVFPKSMLPSFDDCVKVAEQSKCDPDWLALSKEYGCFAVVTEAGKTMAKALRLKAFPPPRPKKKPAYDITQPIILLISPGTPRDMGRLRAICESMTEDPEWEYRTDFSLADLGQRLRIGCRDLYQAKRRAKWLEEQGLKFSWEIIERPS